MDGRWRYRVVSFVGAAVVTVVSVAVTNLEWVHNTFDRVPYFGRPAPEVLPTSELPFIIGTTLLILLASMWPLFKPRPRRILDTILLTQKRVFLAMIGLAALGYYNYTYRMPRTTLMLTTGTLLLALPVFMVMIRRRPRKTSRSIIVGDDPEAMRSLLAAAELPVLGYVSPPSAYAPQGIEPDSVSVTDGGNTTTKLDNLPCLSGLARLDEVLVEQDVDTVLLGFSTTDREEFFGTLETCYEHGVNAYVHQNHADHVLTNDFTGDELLTVDLEPWDWQDHVLKRIFDVCFASAALLLLLPVILFISVAIKLEDGGPLLYWQERTASFGGTFQIAKFRSMIPDAESETGAKLSEEDAGGVDPRVTRVGRMLRKTHLDEIPQLWSILVGDMSVVGPRPERPELDSDIEKGVGNWRRRWFVKPGLTGLAQINDATGVEPEEKLRHDLLYIRQQSFRFDLKIVVRQLWQVGTDAAAFFYPGGSAKQTPEDSELERGDSETGPQLESRDKAAEDTEAESPEK